MTREIHNIIKEWKHEAGVSGIILTGHTSPDSPYLTIFTSNPGLMIGYHGDHGDLKDKYIKKLRTVMNGLIDVHFVETDKYYIR